MTRLGSLVVGFLGLETLAVVQAQQPAGVQSTALPSPPAREPAWAFPVQQGTLPPETPEPKTIAGSTKKYTPEEIDDLMNLPDWLPDLTLQGVGVGGQKVDVAFDRTSKGDTRWRVTSRRGGLIVVRQPPPQSPAATAFGRLSALAGSALGR